MAFIPKGEHMLRKLREARDEEGFTLIELLVVVIIIGILAAIAIPVFLSQRERAWRSSTQSDLRNLAVAEETYYTDSGVYRATTDASADTELTDRGYNPTDGVTVTVSTTGETGFTDGQVYCLRGGHENIAAEDWYMGSGGTLSQTKADGCPQATAPTDPVT